MSSQLQLSPTQKEEERVHQQKEKEEGRKEHVDVVIH